MESYINRIAPYLCAFAVTLVTSQWSLAFTFPERDGKAFDGWCDNGMAKMDKGDYAGAVKDFTVSLELEPKYVESLYRRGYCYMHLKQYEKAAEDFKTITVKAPDAGGESELGEALYRMGRYKEAIDKFTEAAEVNPDPVIMDRGLAQIKLGNWQAAVDDFSSIIKRFPKCAECFLNRAFSLEKMGKTSEATADRALAYKLDKKLKGHTLTDIFTNENTGRASVSFE
jgi:tetratricopeptide (TPR) repeat protein